MKGTEEGQWFDGFLPLQTFRFMLSETGFIKSRIHRRKKVPR